jgi:hypothetical protein
MATLNHMADLDLYGNVATSKKIPELRQKYFRLEPKFVFRKKFELSEHSLRWKSARAL